MASSNSEGMIAVEVAFALPDHQEVIELKVKKGTTALEAVALSGIKNRFANVDFSELGMGVFSRPLNGVEAPVPGEYTLAAGDRVEIYRPLLIDPKQARLDRARKAQLQRDSAAVRKSGKKGKSSG